MKKWFCIVLFSAIWFSPINAKASSSVCSASEEKPILSDDEKWESYFNHHASKGPGDNIFRALEMCSEIPKDEYFALDLGSGTGKTTKVLLENQWTVKAVDSTLSSFDFLRKQCVDCDLDKLTAVNKKFEDLQPEDFLVNGFKPSLIVSEYALPFCSANSFPKFISSVLESLRPEGVFYAQFFGKNHSWAFEEGEMTFLDAKQVQDLFTEFSLNVCDESDEISKSVSGEMDRWHKITVIAKKKSTD